MTPDREGRGARARRSGSARSVVRVNGAGTHWFEDDLAAARELPLEALVLPKATPEAVAALGAEGPPVIAIVETAQGLRLAYETASSPGSPRSCSVRPTSAPSSAGAAAGRPGGPLRPLEGRRRLGAAGIRGPFDIVHLDTRDGAGLEAAARFARSLGFRGKACIHPAQVDDRQPRVPPRRRLRRVGAACARGGRARRAEGRGAVALDGEMIDAPVVERARQDPVRRERRHAWPLSTRARRRSGEGRFYEDFDVGDVFRSRFGRTVTEYDNILFTGLTHNTNSIHFDAVARRADAVRADPRQQHLHARADHRHDRPDTSENAAANLSVDGHQAPEPRVRRRHALGGERDPRQARVEVEPERRHRLDALPRDQPARARS